MDISLHIIAHIRTDLPEKFGVPRQSGLVPELRGTVVFEPEYRNPDALRGLEGFSHLWLIFQFHRAVREELVAHGAAAPAGGQPPYGCVCHPVALPAQCHRPVLRGSERGAAG